MVVGTPTIAIALQSGGTLDEVPTTEYAKLRAAMMEIRNTDDLTHSTITVRGMRTHIAFRGLETGHECRVDNGVYLGKNARHISIAVGDVKRLIVAYGMPGEWYNALDYDKSKGGMLVGVGEATSTPHNFYKLTDKTYAVKVQLQGSGMAFYSEYECMLRLEPELKIELVGFDFKNVPLSRAKRKYIHDKISRFLEEHRELLANEGKVDGRRLALDELWLRQRLEKFLLRNLGQSYVDSFKAKGVIALEEIQEEFID